MVQIETKYTNAGIEFAIKEGWHKLEFPLKDLTKKLIRDEAWDTVNVLEQIWYQGLLQPMNGAYLLNAEDLFELDEDTVEELPITHYKANIGLEENGNVGRSDYRIDWFAIIRGKHAGQCKRCGCIVQAGGYEFLLSREQYKLLLELEKEHTASTVDERARLQAKSKFLAKKAGATISQFMENRDFLFCDTVDLGIDVQDDENIQLQPVIPDLPETLQNELPTYLHGVAQFQNEGKRTRVFPSEKAEKTFNNIRAIPSIQGQAVPQFIENPLKFIPEEIEFDAELFSKRVKGLKVRTASAVPYINIEESAEQTGWFDVNAGLVIHDQAGETEDVFVGGGDKLNELIHEAVQLGQQYVYYGNRWIKVPTDGFQQLQELHNELGKDGRVSSAQAQKILDIYENIEGIEYNETFLQLKEKCLPINQEFQVVNSFCGTLKDYQKEGYGFLKTHYDSRMGVLLADDMGLGKTVQVIALLADIWERGELPPVLLVLPTSLIENWRAELSKFLPAVRALYEHRGSNRYRNAELICKYDVVLTTYETLARDQAMLGSIKWTCVICDEVQKIKNFRTYAASAIKGMNTKCRIALTGTPVENRLSELWSIADFAQPGLLNSYQYFRNHYEKPIQREEENREQLAEELVQKLSPIFLRRTKEAVLGDALPQKHEERILLELNVEQEKLYQTIVNEVHQSEENITLGAIQRLIMLCSHPRLVSKDFGTMKASVLESESPKLAWLVKKLKEIKRSNEKVIIFTGYKNMQNILRQTIYERFGIDARIINGEMTTNRLGVIQEFSATKGFNVLILSPRAAGVGLNIVAANHVIHYTREWNPAIENQATDRVYRIGQEKQVTVYYPIMESQSFFTAEKKLDELLMRKRALMTSVIVPTDLTISWKDFSDIL